MLVNVLLVLLKPMLQNFMEIKQQPLSNVFNKMNTENEINADFAAAFGHAGIPCEKLGHPSIVGLIRKYGLRRVSG